MIRFKNSKNVALVSLSAPHLSLSTVRGISWATKEKVQRANYFGSLTQASTIRVGSYNGEEIHAPFKSLLPMVNPDDVVFGGWDISDMNLANAMARAKVFEIDLQKQLRPYMENMVPLPGIFDADFIAANQGSRANNVMENWYGKARTSYDAEAEVGRE